TLAEAVHVPHTNPVIVYMPDDPSLGKYKETFGGKVGMVDEYPTAAGNGYAGFQGATEILSTRDLWERWRQGEGWIDTRALLPARLLDLFIGDWDRHNGQWRWMKVPGHEVFVPLPEDRDQAFANFSGAVMGLARSAQPKLVSWNDDYDNIPGLLVQGREVDDWLLNGLDRAAFEETAREMQGKLTDAVIESAVRQQPPAWFAVSGERLIHDLEKRRNLLPKAATAFYEKLSRVVDIQGTDQNDVARLPRADDGSAVLELSVADAPAGPANPYFRRRFLPKETKEVRLYLYGGADRFISTGPKGGVSVRVSR